MATRHRRRAFGRFRRPSWLLFFGAVLVGVVYIAVFYHLFVSPFSLRWKAFFGDAKYPEGFSIQGIDISHYQKTINWAELRESTIEGYPIRFVIIKATEGDGMLDENFNDNFYQAREYGLIRGAYHYFVPSIPAESQANYFLRQVHLEPGDIPPVLDFEQAGKLSPQEVKQAALTWLRTVERHYGVKPILYTSYKFKTTYFADHIFDTYPYWIAHYYVDSLRYQGEWRFWQHTDCGQIGGIEGRVDFDVYNGSMYDLKKFTLQRKPGALPDDEDD